MILAPVDSKDLLCGDEDVLQSFAQGFINQFGFSECAKKYLLDVYIVFQSFDDIADDDGLNEARLSQLIYKTLVELPTNTFYLNNYAVLSPIMSNAILKWKASDTSEKRGYANAMSFAWRASYYDIVLAVLNITYGSDVAMKNAHIVMDIYKEKFEDYLKEFQDA